MSRGLGLFTAVNYVAIKFLVLHKLSIWTRWRMAARLAPPNEHTIKLSLAVTTWINARGWSSEPGGAGLAAHSLGLLCRLHCEPLRWLQPQLLAPLQPTLIFLHVESFQERHTAHASLAMSWIFYFSRHLNLKSEYKFLPPCFHLVEGMWCTEDRIQVKLLRMVNVAANYDQVVKYQTW